MHDEALMIQWNRRGDSDAFRTLIQRYGNMVYATALRVLGNPTDAEDVAQDCFEKLARSGKTPRGYLGPWLHRMAVNRALDRVRSDAARKRRETEFEEGRTTTSDLEWEEIYPLVDESINQLPEKLRRALVAHYLEGLTHNEIAERESVSRAAITQRIQRALEQMRNTLQRKGVAVSGAAVLAGTLGGRLAEAATVPVSLTEKLGRIALAGPVVGKTSAVVGMVTLPKAVLGVVVALAIVAGGIAVKRTFDYSTLAPVTPEAEQQRLEAATQPLPVRDTTEDAQTRSLRPAATAIARAADSAGEYASISGYVLDRETGTGIPNVDMIVNSETQQYDISTDEVGAYAVDRLDPDEYGVICCRANGYYIPLEKGQEAVDEYCRMATVAAGQHYNIPDITLGRGESYAARVVDAEGNPVSQAVVTACTEIRQHRITNTALSEQDGQVTVSGFPSTVALYVWAEKGDLVTGIYGPFAVPQVAEAREPLVLQPEAIVRGTVVDEAGRGVAGLRVVPQFAPYDAHREVDAISDPQGRFELKGMFAGTSRLRVHRDREIVNADEIPRLTLAFGEVIEDMVLITRVGGLSISGTVVDPRGNPVPDAHIRCHGNGHDSYPRTDHEGRFVAEDLQPGLYMVSAEHEGFLGVEQADVSAGSVGVRLVMPDAIGVDGRVIDAKTGQPVTDYKIEYCYDPYFMFLDQRYQDMHDEDGRFHLTVAQRGDVRIAVRAKGYLLGYEDVHIEAGMAPLTNVEIPLDPQPDLTGVVHDDAGAPVAGALVFSGDPLRPQDGDYASSRTDADGSFVLPATKLAHDTITIVHPNYPKTAVSLEPRHFAGERIDVVISTGATLAYTVLRDGEPRSGAAVAVTGRQFGNQVLRTTANGTVTFKGLQAGYYALECGIPDGQRNADMFLNERVYVEPGDPIQLEGNFRTGNSVLWGQVLGEGKQYSIDLMINTGDDIQRYYYRTEESTVPEYEFSDLPSGQALLRVYWTKPGQGPDNVSLSKRFSLALPDGVSIQQDLELGGNSTIHGVVSPLAAGEHATVWVWYGRFTWDDWEVYLCDFNRDFSGNIPVAVDGTFSGTGFEPDTYSVFAQTYSPDNSPDFTPRRASAVVVLGEEGADVSLTLR